MFDFFFVNFRCFFCDVFPGGPGGGHFAALGVDLGSIWVVDRSRPGPVPSDSGPQGGDLGEGMVIWTWPLAIGSGLLTIDHLALGS